jgi:thiamine biosynthesis lipoprotein
MPKGNQAKGVTPAEMLHRRQFLSGTSAQRSESSRYWVHLNRAAMACRFEITAPISDPLAVEAGREALDRIDSLESQLSVFRETSEVSIINRTAATGAVKVERELFGLLLLARELSRETEGAFDITTGPLTRCWGFLKREGRIPDPSELEAARSLIGIDKVLLNEDDRTVRFARAGVEINLGSIGKGYALDRIGKSMRSRGVRSALVSGGSSSVLAIGSGARGEGWVVGVRDPRKSSSRMATLRLRHCAMGTSGSSEQYFEYEGKRYGHIIDPRSGLPAEGVLGVTVIAPSAARADALATAFYVGGRELVERYLADHAEVMALMVERNEPNRVLTIGATSSAEVENINE